jgi:pimeloyl-ACP methyl ester carboxylesterase
MSAGSARGWAIALAGLIGLAACAPEVGVAPGAAAPAPRESERSDPADPSDSSDAPGPAADDTAPPGTAGVAPDGGYDPGPIDWDEIDDGVDEATITVPVDYRDPTGPTVDLYLVRHRALDPDNRIGSLLVNPGGPGAPGPELAMFAGFQFDLPLLDRFDIIGWDPRGVGASSPPIECIGDEDYDRMYAEIDSTPDAPDDHAALVAAAQEFAAGCAVGSEGLLEHVGTNNSARDMDTIRRGLGEDEISYFGFSYGSELGAAWVTLFPDTVRAAVLDGASDPDAEALESSLQQLAGFEQSVVRFLEDCAERACDFAPDGDAERGYFELMESLDRDPVPSEPGRPDVNRDVATSAVIQAMYSDSYWPALEHSLAAAQEGDGSGLLELYDAYYRRNPDGSYSNMFEAFQSISCADTPERPTVEEVDAEIELYEQAAPHLVPEGSAGGYFCTFFPPARDPRVEITGEGAGPVLVIGTTGDPATPFASTVAMAEALDDGRLIEVEANQHLGYGVNHCVVEAVNDYLIDLVAPEPRLECGDGGLFG